MELPAAPRRPARVAFLIKLTVSSVLLSILFWRVDRAAFLQQTARPVTISGLEAHDVLIRLLGDVAIIHARTSYKKPDGQPGAGRYTDVWARQGGRWLAVSAHVTRC